MKEFRWRVQPFLQRSALLRLHITSVCLSVRPSVMLVICDHIGWNSSKIISWLISTGFLLSVDLNIMDLIRTEHFQNETNPWFWEHFLRPNLDSYLTSSWVWFSRDGVFFVCNSCGDYILVISRVRFDSLQTTTTNHLYICRRSTGRYFVTCTSSIYFL